MDENPDNKGTDKRETVFSITKPAFYWDLSLQIKTKTARIALRKNSIEVS